MKIEVFKTKRDIQNYVSMIVGAIMILIGIILLWRYIIDFILIFIGLILISGGVYLIWTHKYVKNLRFFRF